MAQAPSRPQAAASMRKAREKRWLVVTQDGRHVTVGRHTDPTPGEIDDLAAALAQQGLIGWLAVSEGDYHGPGTVALMMVRQLSAGEASWDEASTRWHAIRQGE